MTHDSMTAGQEDRTDSGAFVGALLLTNHGEETSYNSKIHVLMEDNYELVNTGGMCIDNVCDVDILESNNTKVLELKIKSKKEITPSVDNINMTVILETNCEKNITISENIDMEVIHSWTLEVQAKDTRDINWDHLDLEDTYRFSQDYTLTNQGPSMVSNTSVLVLIPADSHWVNQPSVVYDDVDCIEDASLPVPETVPENVAKTTELISCSNGPCRMFQCHQGLMRKGTPRNTLVTSLSFQKKTARGMETKNAFLVVTSICVKDSTGETHCTKGKKRFTYYSQSLGDMIIENWKYVLAAAVSLMVILITFAIFKRFRIFSRVRIFKVAEEDDEDKIEMRRK